MRRSQSQTSSSRQHRHHVLLTMFVALMSILSLFSSANMAAAQDGDSTPEQVEDVALGTGSVQINVYECPNEYRGNSLFEDCTSGPEGVSVRLTDLSLDEVITQQNGGDVESEFDDFGVTQPDGGPGVVLFSQLLADQYTVIVDLRGATYNFASYCSDADTGNENPVSPNDENNGQISVEEGQNVICDWYIIPDPNGTLQQEIESGVTATATLEPTEEAEPTEEIAEPTDDVVEPTEDDAETPNAEATVVPGEEIGGSAEGGAITIDMRSCPEDFVDPRSANSDTFAAACTEGTDGVTLRLTDAATQEFTEQVTDAQQNNSFSDLADGTYTLYSDIPGDTASEFLFCVADGGNQYQKEFNENGVTTFADMTGEDIVCSWYVVPEESRGEETGGSLTIHLAACPDDYQGSDYFDDCHDRGIGESPFDLQGPDGSISGTTTVSESDGPGLLAFTDLTAGSYTLQGGPPGDAGTVYIYCSDQQSNEQIPASLDSTQASFDIAEGQDILCDWYFLPESGAGEPTAVPTEEPESRAEILITLFECEPRADGYAGSGFGELDDTCTETLNGVPFRLGDVGAPPLTANTGVSGDGAVRFFDLLPGDYTVKPTLPDDLSNVALYCSIDGSNSVYQKSLQNGETTFVDVDGEAIACSWFVSGAAEQPAGPNGSITVREFLCEGDKGEITDWDQECTAGASSFGYTLTSSEGGVNVQGTPGTSGIFVFEGLPDDFYELEANDGTWCRATAEHVDSSSRVIVKGGGNTDVYLFYCGDVTSLPSTGTGTATTSDGDGFSGSTIFLVMAAVLIVPALIMVFWSRFRQMQRPGAELAEDQNHPTVTERGMFRMRFR